MYLLAANSYILALIELNMEEKLFDVLQEAEKKIMGCQFIDDFGKS